MSHFKTKTFSIWWYLVCALLLVEQKKTTKKQFNLNEKRLGVKVSIYNTNSIKL